MNEAHHCLKGKITNKDFVNYTEEDSQGIISFLFNFFAKKIAATKKKEALPKRITTIRTTNTPLWSDYWGHLTFSEKGVPKKALALKEKGPKQEKQQPRFDLIDEKIKLALICSETGEKINGQIININDSWIWFASQKAIEWTELTVSFSIEDELWKFTKIKNVSVTIVRPAPDLQNDRISKKYQFYYGATMDKQPNLAGIKVFSADQIKMANRKMAKTSKEDRQKGS